MVTALGQADSFNSSGATIIPDRNENGSARQQTRSRLSGVDGQDGLDPAGSLGDRVLRGVPSMVAQARMLMPQDSFGRELAAMTNAGAGGDAGGDDWSFLANTTDDGPSGNSQPIRELTFSQLLNVPSSPPNEAEDFSAVDAHAITQFEANFPSSAPATSVPHIDIFRPSSAHSNFRPSSAQSHTASEYSFSSTDVDTDSVMSDANPQPQLRDDRINNISLSAMDMDSGPSAPQTHFWIAQNQNQNQERTGWSTAGGQGVKREMNWEEMGTVAPSSVSPQEGESSTGPIRNSEDPDRLVRLEHRRQINRKSAQKHRKRRKEELEILSQQVAERDHKISQLEKDLAVERAKTAQLIALVKGRGLHLGGEGAV